MIKTRILSTEDFNGVNLTSSSDVIVKQGVTQEVKAIGNSNVIDDLKIVVADNILKIELGEKCYDNFELNIEITIPNLNKLNISGSGSILVNDFTNQSNLVGEINGSGNITLNGFEGTINFNIALNGSGNFIANKDIGTLNELNLTNSGSGDYSGFNISCGDAMVNVSGSGNSELTANTTLNATISGSGNILYKGSPTTITQNITGSGSLIDAN